MRMFSLDPTVRINWRAYPVRVPGGSLCPTCRTETVLVQSLDGGFVTRNCPSCDHFSTVPEAVFRQLELWVACPACRRRMEPTVLADRNYGYLCANCDGGLRLCELLPRYQDL